MRFQAISEQLIRESRELRTICMLIHHTYNYQHKHPNTLARDRLHML